MLSVLQWYFMIVSLFLCTFSIFLYIAQFPLTIFVHFSLHKKSRACPLRFFTFLTFQNLAGRCHSASRVQLVILSFLFDQLIVRSPLNDPSLLQHHNAVAVAHGGKPVCNHKGGSSAHQLIHTILYQFLRPGINGTGRLIQDQNRRIGNRRPGYRQKLTQMCIRDRGQRADSDPPSPLQPEYDLCPDNAGE